MHCIRYTLIIIFSFVYGCHIHTISAMSLTGEIESRFSRTVSKITLINKGIKKTKNTSTVQKLFFERDTLTRYAKNLYKHLEIRNTLKPTLDNTSRYKLTLQKYLLSCEIAALRTLIEAATLRYFSEEQIIRDIPQYPQPWSEGVWGDPEKEFVGSYHGVQGLKTGYGVYELPLVRYLDQKGIDNEYRNTLISTGITGDMQLSYALKSLEQGSHVLLWGDWCTTPAYDDGIVDKVDMYILRAFPISGRNTCDRSASDRRMSWYTPEGKYIEGLSGEHAFILLGYIGTIENPTHIIVWDTDTGRHIYPILEWVRKWSLLDYRMVIIKGNSSFGKK